jgi:1-deoxy-D-xylulose-5-phosphate synthase
MIPFCNIYSTFLQRAYDQIIHDVALQNLQVVLCLDRGGLVGEDGATHHGAYDLVYLRCIPNMIISAPLNEEELRNLMFTAQLPGKGPFAIRYPKGRGVMPEWKTPFRELEIGKGIQLREGNEVAVLSTGHPGNFVTEACRELEKENIRPAHYHFTFVKPLDEDLLHGIFKQFKKIITVEDGAVSGGFGSAILEFMGEHEYEASVKRLGIPDKFIEQGKNEELHHECGYDADGIIKAVKIKIGIRER